MGWKSALGAQQVRFNWIVSLHLTHQPTLGMQRTRKWKQLDLRALPEYILIHFWLCQGSNLLWNVHWGLTNTLVKSDPTTCPWTGKRPLPLKLEAAFIARYPNEVDSNWLITYSSRSSHGYGTRQMWPNHVDSVQGTRKWKLHFEALREYIPIHSASRLY